MASEQKNGAEYSPIRSENNGGTNNKETYTKKSDGGDEMSPLKVTWTAPDKDPKDDSVRVALMPDDGDEKDKDVKDSSKKEDDEKKKDKRCLFKGNF